ncbi:PTS sugar transporter subunit IIA [Anaerorhabdus sp.]|uniref:Ascorbate-specific PTS system EIIA component n=1 Tax=bioreactor metagenome TaxID=1076179 RepID=A0A645C4M4_9ZZZZ
MIKDTLTNELVLTNVECKTWREAIQISGNLLLKAGKIKEPFIGSMAKVVEELGPYMILLPKVCFFHGQPGENVNEPCLSLIVFKDSVYFDDFENQEIKCAFAFGAIDSDSHMQMLMKVAQLLQNEEFISLITNNGEKDKILEIIQKY